MTSLFGDICHIFCCPPRPAHIAAKFAFLPPPPTYNIIQSADGDQCRIIFKQEAEHISTDAKSRMEVFLFAHVILLQWRLLIFIFRIVICKNISAQTEIMIATLLTTSLICDLNGDHCRLRWCRPTFSRIASIFLSPTQVMASHLLTNPDSAD